MTGEIWKRSKKVLAYALALMMVAGVVQTVAPVRATEGTGETEIATAADTTNTTDAVADTFTWTPTVSYNNGSVTITVSDNQADDGIQWWYRIYKDNSPIIDPLWINPDELTDSKPLNLNRDISEDGKYTVMAWATKDEKSSTPVSCTFDYTAPADALVVEKIEWSSTPGTVEWTLSGNNTSDVLEYDIWLVKYYGENVVWVDYNSVTSNNVTTTYDWSKWITDIKASYKASVKAISKNIALKRSSEEVVTTDIYKPSETVNNVKTGIAGALWNAVSNNDIANTISSNNTATNEAAKIVQALKDVSANSSTSGIANSTVATAVETALKAQDKNGLKLAMQNDLKMVELVEVVEQMKGGLATAEVSANDTDAKEIFGVSANDVKIKVVGAKLNNATKLTLEKSATQMNNGLYISEEYSSENAVALDIKLDTSGGSALAIPVSVTVPVPKNINKSRLVILHMKNNNEVEETLTPIQNSDGTVTFTVSHFSTFVFTEKTTSGGSSGGGGRQDDTVEALITVAAAGATVKTKDITTLSNSTMKALLKRGDVTLVMEYTYKGVDYVVTIPAGKAVDNDIPWYGPLYLAGMYGNGTGADKADKTADTVYVVKRGDTMSKIAKMSGMSLAELAKKNPQIKNLNRIRVGQSINR